MNSNRSNLLSTLGLAAALTAGTASVSSQMIYTYDPGLGTVPDAQGWTAYEGRLGAPATVAGGMLHTYPTQNDGVQSWLQQSVPLDFTTNSYALEIELHILEANYIHNIANNNQRSGYYLDLFDATGHAVMVGLSSTNIVINTDDQLNNRQGLLSTPFDTASGFHTYRLLVGDGQISLFIDGSFFSSIPLGASGMAVPENYNKVGFGDSTGLGSSSAEVRSVRFQKLPASSRLEVRTYAGVTLYGVVDAHYRIEFTPVVANPPAWQTLTNLTLATSPVVVIDYTSPDANSRYYRAVQVP